MKKNLFNAVKITAPNLNHFDLSHDVKMSCRMGNLVPVMLMDCVPGDKVKLSAEALIRFAPMIAPVMHRMDVYFHYFFVPNRILWPKWEDFITNTPDEEGNLPAFPYVGIGNSNQTELCDYLGLPTIPAGNPINVSALPFAAYQKVYNDYYRDQNLMEDLSSKLVLQNGDNTGVWGYLGPLQNRCWEHDYFTAALPWAQKGQAVDIPVGSTVDSPVFRNFSPLDTTNLSNLGTGGNVPVENKLTTEVDDDTLYVEGQDLEPTTINDLRRAFKLQEWLEKAARGGSRYIEMVKSFFNVNSSDKRLQRPEYITGTKSPVVISEVLNTTGTEDAPQGNMAGHGVSVVSGNAGGYYCEEHGYIIGIMSVLPKTAYQQGVPKHFLKINDPFEFYWPQFAHIGEQPVENQEVWLSPDNTNRANPFGYVPRYAEYKFMQSRVAGEFKTSLNTWHLGRIFDTEPALNEDFVMCRPEETTRIFAVSSPEEQNLWCHVYNKVHAIRPMPVFGTPTF